MLLQILTLQSLEYMLINMSIILIQHALPAVTIITKNNTIQEPFSGYVMLKLCFFFKPTHSCLTLHNKCCNPIHMQYVDFAWFLKRKIKNELYGAFSKTIFPLHKIWRTYLKSQFLQQRCWLSALHYLDLVMLNIIKTRE